MVEQMLRKVPVFGDTPPDDRMVNAQHHRLGVPRRFALASGKRHRDRVLHRKITVQKQRADIVQQPADERFLGRRADFGQPLFGDAGCPATPVATACSQNCVRFRP